MHIVVWRRDVVARYLHDVRAGGRHDLGGVALVVGGSDRGHRVGRGWNVGMCRRRSGKLGRLRLGGMRIN
jgi:hypothetical protein